MNWDWLSSITEGVGSIFGGSNSSRGTVVPSSDPGQKGGGIFSGTDFYGPLIQAGTALAGQYFSQRENRRMAEDFAGQRQTQLAHDQRNFDAELAVKKAAIEQQRKATLANLYANYMNNVQRGGEASGKLATETGQNAITGISSRGIR